MCSFYYHRHSQLVLSLLFFATVFAARFDPDSASSSEHCFRIPAGNNETSAAAATSKFSVTCKLRTLDQSSAANLSVLSVENTSKLKLKCSSDLFFQSFMPESLQRLHELEDLQISHCKLLKIEPSSFEGLYNLKKLAINTYNSNWGSGKSLDISAASFLGLKELQNLDLAQNNIRAIIDGTFCNLANLQTLNLTKNRIRLSEKFGFNSPECSGSEIQNLDLSHNELKTLSENSGLSKLRRLQTLDLRFNNISEISGEALAGLVSLRILNLANNRIEILPEGLFAGSRELREIHLQNNSLFSLAKGIFHRLEQLLILDLSGNQLTSNHVDAGTFTGLIRLIVLNLSHNALTRIDGRTFKDLYFLQILDLRNNSIGFIEDNAFIPLYNLHTLNLAENRLNTIGPLLFNGLFVLSKLTLNNNLVVSIDPTAFTNCSALKELDLSSNALQEVPQALRELSFLKTLDLGENQISEFTNGSFKNLNQLTGLRLIDNNVGNLTRGMLWDLPSLQVLNLAKNKIQSIERGTFERNTQLEAIRLDENYLTDINGVFTTLVTLLWLNLSDNHLVWFDYAFIPSNLKWLDIHRNFIEHLGNYYKIQDEIRVKTLDASHNRITEISPLSIPNSVELLFINNNFIKQVHANTFADKVNLARVDMYANDLTNLDMNALRLNPVSPNKPLPEFYLGGNPFNCDCSMEWLGSARNVSSSRRYPKIMDLDNVMCKMTHSSKGSSHMPLSRAKPSDFLCTYETHCFALCHCCEFDACDCEMTCPQNCTCYHDQTWNTNVVDCSSQNSIEIPHRIPMDATEVYLDGNKFHELENHVFIGRKNMRVLFVNQSEVRTIQNSTFNGLYALHSLHLEDNQIRRLEGYEFEHLSSLKELYLHNNLIRHVANRTFDTLKSLEILRLDGNKLAVFPVWFLSTNLKLNELSLGQNPWTCRCKFLVQFQSWVGDNAPKIPDLAQVQCFNSENTPGRQLDFNSTECSDFFSNSSVIDTMLVSDYWKMLVLTLSIVIFLLLVLVLWFIFRDSVRVWLYSRYGIRLCSFRGHSGPNSSAKHFEDRDKLYDAFVCYSPKDEEWVVQALALELETDFQMCLHYRDLPHAAYLQHAAPAVLEACEASRRVVLVLTRNFLQTEWSRFELRQALHEALKGRCFKLVILEEGQLPEADLDLELRPYLKTGHRVRWGEKRFWEKLRYAMPSTSEPRSAGKINANYSRRNINNYTIDSRMMMTNGTINHHHNPNSTYPHPVHNHQHNNSLHHHAQHTFQPEKVLKNHHQHQTGGTLPPSPAPQQMYPPPPAYSSSTLLQGGAIGGQLSQQPQQQEIDDPANYSSATTATPSPRPVRKSSIMNNHAGSVQRGHTQQQTQLEINNLNLNSSTTTTTSSNLRPVSDHIYSSIDSDYSTLERGGSGGRRAPHTWRPPLNVLLQQQSATGQQQQPSGNSSAGGQAYLV